MDLFFNREGEPIPTLEWAELYENYGYRFLSRDEIPDTNLAVVTIWEGVNHAVWPDEPRTLFNTGLVREGDDFALLHEWRWTTEAAALDGHAKVLAKVLEVGYDPDELEKIEEGRGQVLGDL